MNDKRNYRISKFLSWSLRHNPEELGLALEPGGWVSIDGLIKGAKKKNLSFTIDDLKEIVKTNKKQRFAMTSDKIRANQGHSKNVDLQLSAITPPIYLYHGTATRFIDSIKQQGLTKHKRHHIHMSMDEETAKQVGQRYGLPVILVIKAKFMADNGFKFYKSENNVWFIDSVPSEYIIFP